MIVQWVVDAFLAEPSISGLIADRSYPGAAPDAPTYPFAIVSKITGVGESDFAGDAGIERARVQINIKSIKGYADVVAIRAAIRAFMLQRPVPIGPPCAVDSVSCINDFDLPAPGQGPTDKAGPRVRERVLEFVIWARP